MTVLSELSDSLDGSSLTRELDQLGSHRPWPPSSRIEEPGPVEGLPDIEISKLNAHNGGAPLLCLLEGSLDGLLRSSVRDADLIVSQKGSKIVGTFRICGPILIGGPLLFDKTAVLFTGGLLAPVVAVHGRVFVPMARIPKAPHDQTVDLRVTEHDCVKITRKIGGQIFIF